VKSDECERVREKEREREVEKERGGWADKNGEYKAKMREKEERKSERVSEI